MQGCSSVKALSLMLSAPQITIIKMITMFFTSPEDSVEKLRLNRTCWDFPYVMVTIVRMDSGEGGKNRKAILGAWPGRDCVERGPFGGGGGGGRGKWLDLTFLETETVYSDGLDIGRGAREFKGQR